MSMSIQKLHNYNGTARERMREMPREREKSRASATAVRVLPIAEVCQQVSSCRLSANGSFAAAVAALPPRLAAPAYLA